MIKSVTYLVETANEKNPNENTLGTQDAINNLANLQEYGHIPRNINVILALAKSIMPSVELHIINKGNYIAEIQLKINGCFSVDKSQIYIELITSENTAELGLIETYEELNAQYIANKENFYNSVIEFQGKGDLADSNNMFIKQIQFKEEVVY